MGPGVGGFRAVFPYSFSLRYDDVEFSSLCMCTMGVVVHVLPTVCWLLVELVLHKCSSSSLLMVRSKKFMFLFNSLSTVNLS